MIERAYSVQATANSRALAVLTASGESSEAEIGIREMHRDASVALVRVARRDPGVAEAVAAETRRHAPPLPRG